MSTRRQAISTRKESEPTNHALIVVARRLSFRMVDERTVRIGFWLLLA